MDNKYLDKHGLQYFFSRINKIKADIDSPDFVGIPTAPTAQIADNSDQIATTKFVKDLLLKLEGIEIITPSNDETPKVYFDSDSELPQTKAEGEVSGLLKYISENAKFTLHATLKVQGDSSAHFAKKNYTIKLFEDAEHTSSAKIQFKTWPKMSSFVMKAHWIDHSHIRNISAAEIWRQIMESRSDYDQLPAEITEAYGHGATSGFSFRFWFNGQYYGLYEMIMPKKETFKLDKSNPAHSLLNSDYNSRQECTFEALNPNLALGWTEEFQSEMPQTTLNSFGEFIKLIARGDEQEIIERLPDFVDIQTVIDFDIFARIFNIVDNVAKNQLFATFDGNKWYEGAWDLDATLGLGVGGSIKYYYNNDFWTGYIPYADHGLQNKLYKTIENLYLNEFRDRYFNLRETVLSASNIINIYEQNNDRVAPWLDEDYASTTADGKFTGIPSTTTNNIQQIRSFLQKRLRYMDSEISRMSKKVAKPTYTLTKENLVTLSCSTDGAAIYYTTNGSTPTVDGTLYTGEFTAEEGAIIKVIGVKDDFQNSDILIVYTHGAQIIIPEYLQFDGQTAFNTNYVRELNDTLIIAEFEPSADDSQQCLLGSRVTTVDSGDCTGIYANGGTYSGLYAYGKTFQTFKANGAWDSNVNRHRVIISEGGLWYEKIFNDGTIAQAHYYNNTNVEKSVGVQPIYIGAMNENGSEVTDYFKGKLFYVQIYNNGELVHDYRPSNDNTLVDLINQEEVEKIGTGSTSIPEDSQVIYNEFKPLLPIASISGKNIRALEKDMQSSGNFRIDIYENDPENLAPYEIRGYYLSTASRYAFVNEDFITNPVDENLIQVSAQTYQWKSNMPAPEFVVTKITKESCAAAPYLAVVVYSGNVIAEQNRFKLYSAYKETQQIPTELVKDTPIAIIPGKYIRSVEGDIADSQYYDLHVYENTIDELPYVIKGKYFKNNAKAYAFVNENFIQFPTTENMLAGSSANYPYNSAMEEAQYVETSVDVRMESAPYIAISVYRTDMVPESDRFALYKTVKIS